jgi:chromosome segregation ATPase
LGSASSEEVETLRRYATLKERESREKDTTIQILQKKIEQVLEKLEKSETERRRLTLAMDEAEVHRRTLEEERDQAKHSIARLENTQQEEMRAFQLRLDNAQFQATRSEKKLEDFRERVRMDIQKIRSRERELANRLELQKRDAEALLSAKDERLLGHKREIDRLEFEVETLRNRLLEQTERAEERVGKLTRALRALKMAEGMLSGIEDEVLPAAAGGDAEGTGEAA